VRLGGPVYGDLSEPARRVDAVRQAVALDPLCGAVLDTQKILKMCDEMFRALGRWMPQFRGKK